MQALSPYELMTILLLILWMVLFIHERDLRVEMLTLGILGLFLLPLSFSVLEGVETTYGFSLITFTDLLFTFTIASLAGVLFHVVLGKHYHLLPSKKQKVPDESVAQWWLVRLFFALLFFVWTTLLLAIAFDIPLAGSLLIAATILAVYIVSHRHDLIYDAIASALLTAFIVFLAAELAAAFTGNSVSIRIVQSGSAIGSVPTDLIIWSLAIGLILGPLYEYIRRIELK